MADWRDALNPEQRRAVEHGDGPLLVVAGAGSGKTRTLACRVAHLLERGAAPERIMLLTFTRRAAREMIGRVEAMASVGGSSRVVGGTFHSVANRLLRRHARSLGLSPSFTVMDQSDAADLMGIVRADRGSAEAADRRFPRKDTLLSIYSRVVNAAEPLPQVLDERFPWCRGHADEIAGIFTGFTERKREHDVLDYDDLLLYWRAAATDAALGPVLAREVDHVLVDEYQDVNAVQADIVAATAPDGRGVTVVGDDAQAIYGFRAASIDNMLAFPQRFPDTTVVTLDRNYRSTPQVLAAANAVMASATEGYSKTLRAVRPAGDPPVLAQCRDEAAEAANVADEVLAARERGVALRDQAVLFRTGHHADRLELELGRRDVPFRKFGGLAFLEAAHVKDLLALLRILDNPYDELAWQRTLSSLDRMGPVGVRRAAAELGVTTPGGPPPDPLRRFLDASGDWAARDEDVECLRAALAGAAGSGPAEPPPAEQVAHLLTFCAHTFPRRYREPGVRLADLEQLADLAAAYPTRSRLLTELVLDPPASTSDLAGPPHLDEEYLTLSTIHSAKGGEWDVVHVIHAADGNIPSDMSLGTPGGVEEERRLLYVAMTRACDELHVSFPLRFHHRSHGDAHSTAQPSRFLDGMGGLFERRVVGADGTGGDGAPAAVPATGAVGDYLSSLW